MPPISMIAVRFPTLLSQLHCCHDVTEAFSWWSDVNRAVYQTCALDDMYSAKFMQTGQTKKDRGNKRRLVRWMC